MRIIFLIFLLFSSVFADINNTKDLNNSIKYSSLLTKENELIKQLSQNEFYINYQTYLNYIKLQKELKRYKYLARKNPKYKEKYTSIKTELELLKNNQNIFKTLINLRTLPKPPEIHNPFQIFNAISYEKEIKDILNKNQKKYILFQNTLKQIKDLFRLKQKLNQKTDTLLEMINDFNIIKTVYLTKLKTINSQAEIYLNHTKNKIKYEINKLIFLAVLIAISVIFFILLKHFVRKYIKEESVYITNKIINFINISVILLIIMFFYINNATYIITILGFASAGIAIAMKDWFMNIFGWFVIITGGNFKVGDRIKVYLQNGRVEIVGDIIDISVTRIIIYEDVTLGTYTDTRRAGRIVFIPNNIIFTNPIFNYTHQGLSTIWDGIDITITFDSNHKKAAYLAKEIVNKYSKGYTDITKRRLKKLKSIYNIKTANLEPRIFTFINDYGIVISCWYLNNYSPLGLRSTISMEILDAFKKEDDIKITYQTYVIKKENGQNQQTQIPL